MASVILFFLTGCGITQSTINNIQSDNASNTMEVNPDQNTSVTASPTIDLPINPK